MKRIPTHFSSLIKLRRQELGLTLETVARSCGISASYVNRLEVGEKPRPTYEKVQSLAKCLDLPMSMLYNATAVEDSSAFVNDLEFMLITQDYTYKGKEIQQENKEKLVSVVKSLLDCKIGDNASYFFLLIISK